MSNLSQNVPSVLWCLLLLSSCWGQQNFKKCHGIETSEYKYSKWYDNGTTPYLFTKNNGTVRIDFFVQTAREALLLLTQSPVVDLANPVANLAYEIVIGGDNNTFTCIRLRTVNKEEEDFDLFLRGFESRNSNTQGVVSEEESRGFWIEEEESGCVSVGRRGETTPLVEWLNPEPLNVKFVAFGSWGDANATWKFACVDPSIPDSPPNEGMEMRTQVGIPAANELDLQTKSASDQSAKNENQNVARNERNSEETEELSGLIQEELPDESIENEEQIGNGKEVRVAAKNDDLTEHGENQNVARNERNSEETEELSGLIQEELPDESIENEEQIGNGKEVRVAASVLMYIVVMLCRIVGLSN